MGFEEFSGKYQGSRPVSPLVAYREGKLEGLGMEPVISKSPMGNYSTDELIDLSLNGGNTSFGSAFLGFSSHVVELVNGLTPELQEPVAIRYFGGEKDGKTEMQYAQHVCTKKDDWGFYCSGKWAGELTRTTGKETNITAAISRYESLLSRYGKSWESLAKCDLKPLAKLAGDLQFVKAMDFLKGSVEPYMTGFDARKSDFGTDHHLSETPAVVYDWFDTAKSMFQIANDDDGVKRVEETISRYQTRLKPILAQIKAKYGFIPY